MNNPGTNTQSPPDWPQRMEALNTRESFMVRAPAGSGKTHLLTTRFLRLLAEVNDPREVVAITFTRAAAAEMRQRIVLELENAQAAIHAGQDSKADHADPLRQAARKAVERIRSLRWSVMDYPDQLRIQTIDSFCNSIAMRAPLQWGILSALGGRMEPAKNSRTLYRKAARRTLAMLENGPDVLQAALRTLLRLRDAQWLSMENLLCDMLADRGRWFKDFVFDSTLDESILRSTLEAPMRNSALATIRSIHAALQSIPGLEDELFQLLRFAADSGPEDLQFVSSYSSLPSLDKNEISADDLRSQLQFYRTIAGFLLTNDFEWRKPKGLTKNQGFPATDAGRAAKERFGSLVACAQQISGLQPLLRQVSTAAVAGYSEQEWRVVLDAFVVMRYAAAQLQLVFAENGAVDYTEVASMALQLLHQRDGLPSEFALDFATGIRHLLLDEFQDTSRKQYELIDSIVAAWPGGDGRTCFCVGDPMQSIYGFRESDYELFDRPAQRGFGKDHDDFADSNRIVLLPIQLTANFRSIPKLIADLNQRMPLIFATSASSLAPQTPFVPAQAVRGLSEDSSHLHPVTLHLQLRDETSVGERAAAKQKRDAAWLPLVQEHWQLALAAQQQRESQASNKKYRIAILGRNNMTLIAAAETLHAAGIPFRADEIFPFDHRMEILDAISLAQAALNPEDRLAWASVLRAPWCGLALNELHALISADDPELKDRAIPDLVQERLQQIADSIGAPRSEALLRCTQNILEAGRQRQMADGEKLGSWLHRLWQCVGGEWATARRQSAVA
jgi:ATP-dependent exoDNAse (exonuclease V) beta subunit